MTIQTPTNNTMELPNPASLARWAVEFLRARPEPEQESATCVATSSLAAGSLPPAEPSPLAQTTLLSLPVPHVGRFVTVTGESPPTLPTFSEWDATAFVAPVVPPAVARSSLAAPAFSTDSVSPPVPTAFAAGLPQKQPTAGPSTDTGQPFYFLDFAPPATATPLGIRPENPLPAPVLDVRGLRRDFPILQERVNGKPLIWFDNAATTQKPQAVIDRLAQFYTHENSNIHRAAHVLAARATDAYENARAAVRRFIGAADPDEIVFVRGTTEGINLIAQSWGQRNIGPGDEIVVSHLEHHANIVPWQSLAQKNDARLRVIPVDDDGQIRLDALRELLNEKTRLVAVTQVSNALGTVTPVAEIIAAAHAVGARVLVDGAQSVAHLAVNVRALDVDFFVFSGHKIYGPTGIGTVYAKREILENMPPWQGGGNMIQDVTFEHTVYQGPPARFEAGTGNIADATGLATALAYVERVGLPAIAAYEHLLLEYTTAGLREIPGVRLIGTAAHKASVSSFVLDGYATEEVGRALNEEGIAVRTGHHCAQPILRRFGLEATVRPSFAFYNTTDEIDCLLAVVRKLAGRST